MMGNPGAGKTTVAEIIAGLTGAVHLNSDKFRQHMFSQPRFNEAEHVTLYGALDYLTELILNSGKSVIYDANLNRYVHRKEKYDLCKKVRAKSILIWVNTAEDLARQRATKEADSNPFRRPFGNMSANMFERIVRQIEPPGENEPFVKLDGSKIEKKSVEKILTDSFSR